MNSFFPVSRKVLFLVALALLSGCSRRSSDEEAIRGTLAEFNHTYELKDIERWTSFFSYHYFEKMEARQPGGFGRWKERVQKTIFDPYRQVKVASTILSIEKIPHGYVSMELISLTGVDSAGNEHTIEKNTRRSTTFIQREKNWEIEDLRNIRMPARYDSLTTTYADIGKPGFAYVGHISLNIVSVIDPRTNVVVGTIPAGQGSSAIAFASASDRGYVANFVAGTVTVFEKHSNKKISDIPVGFSPHRLLINPAEDFLFVSHQSSDGLWVLERKTEKIVRKLTAEQGDLCWSQREQKLYASQLNRPSIDVIDPYHGFTIEKIAVVGRPLGLAMTPDERFLYVAIVDSNEVMKIETASKKVVKRLTDISSPRGIVIDPEGKFAYVTCVLSDKLAIIDLVHDVATDSIAIGRMPTDVAFNAANHCVYVTNQGAGTVTVFNTVTRAVSDTIVVADNPITLSIDNSSTAGGLSIR